MGDENNVMQRQQSQMENVFKTEQKHAGNVQDNVRSSLMQGNLSQTKTEQKSLEERLNKEEAVSAEQITATEKAAATAPDADATEYNTDFKKTDIAFNKLSPDEPVNPRPSMKVAENALRKSISEE